MAMENELRQTPSYLENILLLVVGCMMSRGLLSRTLQVSHSSSYSNKSTEAWPLGPPEKCREKCSELDFVANI
jgi:hypothetical protein